MSGREDDPRIGRPNGDSREMPADLAAVQADDALLDMLGGPHRTPGDVDGELAQLLVAWRGAVQADSDRELVDVDTALAVINAARRPARRRRPVFGTAAAAAAVLVIAFAGVGLVAKSAQPGDQLWGVTQVLYPEFSRSVEAAAFVQTELKEAETAIRQGKPEQARAKLQLIQQRLPAIGEAEGRTDLIVRQQDLERRLDGKSGPTQSDLSTAPSGTPRPSVTPTPSPSPAVEVTPTPSATPAGEVTSTPSPSPAVEVTPKPSATPAVERTPTPSATPAIGPGSTTESGSTAPTG